MFHQIWYTLLDDSHTTVPLENPRRILDIGCGTGDWAEDMGVAYPNAEVIGTDIAPLQPTSVPRNVFFEIDDAEWEGGWNWTESFDFVHIRSMKGAFKDWTKIYQESYTHLEPGGWIEVLDFDDHVALLDYFKEEPIILNWFNAILEATANAPTNFDASHLEPALLEAQGFMNVTIETYDIPMGAWGSSKEEKNSAMVFLELQANAVEALCLRTLHEWGGWDFERIDQLCQEVVQTMKRMAKNPRTAEGCFFRVKVLKGRKPLNEPYTTTQFAGKQHGFLSAEESDFNDSESVTTVTKDNVNEK
jgi:SAM-dependent methyltransferase